VSTNLYKYPDKCDIVTSIRISRDCHSIMQMDLRDKSRGAQKQALFRKCNAKAAIRSNHLCSFQRKIHKCGLNLKPELI